MKLKLTTDYAIRIVVYLAQQGTQILTAKDTAEKLGITYSYFNKVAARIKQAGFIEAVKGPGGGYMLAKKPSDITLFDIVETMEGSVYLNLCTKSGGYCSRYAGDMSACRIHQIFEAMQENMISVLKSKKICDVC